jgi:hypothetical protein
MNSSAVYPPPSGLLPKIACIAVSLSRAWISQLPCPQIVLPFIVQLSCASMVSAVAVSATDSPLATVKVQVDWQVPPGLTSGLTSTAPFTLPVFTIANVSFTLATAGLVVDVGLVVGRLAVVPELGLVEALARRVVGVTPPTERLVPADPVSVVVRDVAFFVVPVVVPG